MQIFIRTKGFQLTNAIENHISSRIHLILSRFSDVIRKVEVFVSDENGPRGGIDKSCVVRIKTDQRLDLVVKDLEDDLYIAVTRALARAKQSLTRHLQRVRTFDRRRITSVFEDQPIEGSLPLLSKP